MRTSLTPHQRKLLHFLRACETNKRTFSDSEPDADDAAGYKGGTFGAYLRKDMLKAWVTDAGGGRWRVTGLWDATSEDFRLALSQVKGTE